MARTSERTNKIIELRAEGLTIREIAAELNISINSLNMALTRLRKSGRVPRIDKQEEVRRQLASKIRKRANPQIILDLYNQGLSQSNVAKQLNQKTAYVHEIVKNLRTQKAATLKTWVIELYDSGKTYKEMAQITGRSMGYLGVIVYKLVKKGIITHRTKPELIKIARNETTQDFFVLPIPKKPTKTYKLRTPKLYGLA